MSRNDLKTLVTEVQVNKAEAKSLREVLEQERTMHDSYEEKVNKLIEAQQAERGAAQDVIKELQRKSRLPALELYTGYNTQGHFEGGVRLIWQLN